MGLSFLSTVLLFYRKVFLTSFTLFTLTCIPQFSPPPSPPASFAFTFYERWGGSYAPFSFSPFLSMLELSFPLYRELKNISSFFPLLPFIIPSLSSPHRVDGFHFVWRKINKIK